MEEGQWLTCSCCGTGIRNTAEENMDYETGARDEGFGTCSGCADWSFHLVMDPIFKKVRDALNPQNQAKFDAMDDGRKAHIVQKLVDKGTLSWGIGG